MAAQIDAREGRGEGDKADWIAGTEAARILGCHNAKARRLARMGLIAVRKIPGSRPRYLRADVERLAAESTTPARAAAGSAAS